MMETLGEFSGVKSQPILFACCRPLTANELEVLLNERPSYRPLCQPARVDDGMRQESLSFRELPSVIGEVVGGLVVHDEVGFQRFDAIFQVLSLLLDPVR